MLHLLEYLLDRISLEEMEIFLNKRAVEFLEEYRQAQVHLTTGPVLQTSMVVWKPPPDSAFKLNFNAVIFSKVNRSGFGAIV